MPALDLAEGSRIRFGEIDLEVLHTPGHTEGSVCLLAAGEGLLLTGDTLFAGSWGRTDLPGGSDDQMVESLSRLGRLGERPARAARPRTGVDHRRRAAWLEQVVGNAHAALLTQPASGPNLDRVR